MKRLAAAPTVAKRRDLPGLEPGRADIILGGAIILEQAMAVFGIDELVVSDYALREGALLDAFQRRHGAALHHLHDLRRRSVVRLAEMMDEEPEHSAHVAELALELFDETDRAPRARRRRPRAARSRGPAGQRGALRLPQQAPQAQLLRDPELRSALGLHRPRDRDGRPGRPLPPQERALGQARRVRRAPAPATRRRCASSPASCGWPSASTAPTPGSSPPSGPAGEGKELVVEAVRRARHRPVASSSTPPTERRGLLEEVLGCPVRIEAEPAAVAVSRVSRPDRRRVAPVGRPRRQASTSVGTNSSGSVAHTPWSPATGCTVAPGMASASRRWRCGGTTESSSVTTTAVGHVDRPDPVPRGEAGQRLPGLDDHPGVVLQHLLAGQAPEVGLVVAGVEQPLARSSGGPGGASPGPPATPARSSTPAARPPARLGAKLRLVAHSTRPSTRSGWRRHTSWAIGPPIE